MNGIAVEQKAWQKVNVECKRSHCPMDWLSDKGSGPKAKPTPPETFKAHQILCKLWWKFVEQIITFLWPSG